MEAKGATAVLKYLQLQADLLPPVTHTLQQAARVDLWATRGAALAYTQVRRVDREGCTQNPLHYSSSATACGGHFGPSKYPTSIENQFTPCKNILYRCIPCILLLWLVLLWSVWASGVNPRNQPISVEGSGEERGQKLDSLAAFAIPIVSALS